MSTTNSLGYRPELDGIRGIAILLVLAHHLYVPGTPGGGQAGVQIFFVLSGFLITTLLIEEHRSLGGVSLRRFYVRRARRLMPAVGALIAVVLLVMAVRGQLSDGVLSAAFTAGYVANWAQSAGYDMGHFIHAWSLSVEEQFYLVWPILLLVGLRVRRLAISGAIAIVIGVLLVAIHVGRPDLDFGLDRAGGLMIGCLLSMAWASGRMPRGTLLLGVLGLATFWILLPAPFDHPTVHAWGLVLIGIASAGLIIAAMDDGPVARALRFAPLIAIGKISYSLYLWHFAVIWEVWPRLVLAGWGWLPTAVVCGTLSVVFALISYRYIEQPLRVRKSAGAIREPAPVLRAQPPVASRVAAP